MRTLGAVLSVILLAACLPAQAPSPPTGIETSVLDAPAEPASEQDLETPDPELAPTTSFETPPPPPLPPALRAQQADCTRAGGNFIRTGVAGLWTCQRSTRDSGRRCTKDGDCEGLCLARTNTCAPVVPLFGCHEVLDSLGRRNTLCID